jgi:predicted GTPase
MKRTYPLTHQSLAYVLLVSFFLQSCGSAGNAFIPIEKEPKTSMGTPLQPIATQVDIQPLIGQELVARGGHGVTFYQEAGALKADVEINAPQGFSKSYEGVNVYIEKGTELTNLSYLDKQQQERRIHLQLAKGNQPAKIVIYKATGLMGGGDTKDDNEGKAETIEGQEEEAEEKEDTEEKGNVFTPDEVIVFCGNPGVGKSSLCNSIFQQAIFQSGVSWGSGMTESKQEQVYQSKLYIDTPGLSDTQLRERAAKEIEEALKHNNNYKIVFVATIESGRIRPDDLTTINVVCDAIKTEFEYGLIFNKVSEALEEKINQLGMDQTLLNKILNLVSLHKKPSAVVILQESVAMKDRNNEYFQKDEKNRLKLLSFLNGLKANLIAESAVDEIDVKDFQKKIDELEKSHKSAMQELQKALKEQEEKIRKERVEYEERMRELKAEQEEREKKLRAEHEEREKKLRAEQEERDRKFREEQEEKDRKFREEQKETEKKFREEQKEIEKKLKEEQEERDRKYNAEKEQYYMRTKAEQEEIEKKLRAEQEEIEKKLRAEQEKRDRKFREEQEEKDRKFTEEQDKREKERKVEQEENDRKLREEQEEKDRKTRAEHQEEIRKLKDEQQRGRACGEGKVRVEVCSLQ